MLIAQLLISA